MKRIALILFALVGIACLALPPVRAASICSPPLLGGGDFFPNSEGSGTIMIPGIGPVPFFVCGPSSISRGDPVAGPAPGQCTIPTEIVAMTLTGVLDPCGFNTPILFSEDPGIMSIGEVVSNLAGELPGTSFFDVYTLVDIPLFAVFGMPYYVKVYAHAVSLGGVDSLAHLPPGATTPGGPPCVEEGDDYYAAGFPDDHEHIPCPKHAICCRLDCGQVIRVSDRTCQRFHGQPLIGQQCPQMCAAQPTSLMRKSWGSMKTLYR